MRRRRLSESSWTRPKLPWLKIRRSGVGSCAASPDIGADFRLWLLAVARAGYAGHAVFDPGELLDLLPRIVRSTGEITRYDERSIRKLIGSLVEAELLAPDSNARCLVVPMDVIDGNERSRIHCPEHRHRDAWHRGGWVRLGRSGLVAMPDHRERPNTGRIAA